MKTSGYLRDVNYKEAREEFIQTWGSLGSTWGVNKTMAQIHAYLLSSDELVTTDQMMEDLQISRGNANMNVRTLVDWGLAYKQSKAGERMDYYAADKDVHSFAPKIARERRKRELEPAMRALSRLKGMELEGKEGKSFQKLVKELDDFTSLGDQFLRRYIEGERGWLTKLFMRMLK